MKQITLNIPDSKYQFFVELINNLGFDKSEEVNILDQHKTIVRERTLRSNENPERLLNWDEVKDDFKFD